MDIYNSIFSSPTEFDWDEGNINKNQDKHKVSLDECEQVFFNKPTVFFRDEKHSIHEKRYGVLGISDKTRKLAIVFTVRKNKIRVISARDQSKTERKIYDND